MNKECIQDFRTRRSAENFQSTIKREHSLVKQISFEEDPTPPESRRGSRQSLIGSLGSDLFSSSSVDGFSRTKKFLVLNSTLEVDSYNFWSEIWESGSRIIVRFDRNRPIKSHWLNSSLAEFAIGEFVIWKKIVADKYYTLLEISVRNTAERKTRKLFHFQYWDFPAITSPFNSAQLVCFLRMINKEHKTAGPKKKPGPIVIHSIGCLERAASICVLDICLEQLMKTNSVSVPEVLLGVVRQVALESFSFEEYAFINQTLVHSVSAIDWNQDARSGESLRSRVKKYCMVFKRASVY